MKKYTKGFTLIELLVVIAIIGILSSVVLVSLNTARLKARDAKYQAEFGGLRTALEAGYNNNSYTLAMLTGAPGEITAGTGDAAPYVLSLRAAAPDLKIYGTISSGAWSIYGRLPSKAAGTFAIGDWWCVDSTGKAGVNTAVYVAADLVTPGITSCTHNP